MAAHKLQRNPYDFEFMGFGAYRIQILTDYIAKYELILRKSASQW